MGRNEEIMKRQWSCKWWVNGKWGMSGNNQSTVATYLYAQHRCSHMMILLDNETWLHHTGMRILPFIMIKVSKVSWWKSFPKGCFDTFLFIRWIAFIFPIVFSICIAVSTHAGLTVSNAFLSIINPMSEKAGFFRILFTYIHMNCTWRILNMHDWVWSGFPPYCRSHCVWNRSSTSLLVFGS